MPYNVGFSLAVSNEECFLIVGVVGFPALSFGLLCEFVCGTGRAQHLPSDLDVTFTIAMPTWKF